MRPKLIIYRPNFLIRKWRNRNSLCSQWVNQVKWNLFY